MISQVFIFGVQIALFWITKHFSHSTGPDPCIIITEIERRLQNTSIAGALVFAVSFILQLLVRRVLAKHLIVRTLRVKAIRQWRKQSILNHFQRIISITGHMVVYWIGCFLEACLITGFNKGQQWRQRYFSKTLLCLYFIFLRPILQFLDWWNRILGRKNKPRSDAMEEHPSHIPADYRLFPFNFTVDIFMTYISERPWTAPAGNSTFKRQRDLNRSWNILGIFYVQGRRIIIQPVAFLRRPSLNEKHGCSSTCSFQSTDQEVAGSPYRSSPCLVAFEKAETEWSVKQDRVFLKTSRSFNSPILKFVNPEMEMERQIPPLHLQRLRKRMAQCALKRKPVRARSS